jgi:hypothetical protein
VRVESRESERRRLVAAAVVVALPSERECAWLTERESMPRRESRSRELERCLRGEEAGLGSDGMGGRAEMESSSEE